MGKPVTVDSDDLEKIITLTAYAKQIEQLLHQRKGDPFLPKNESEIKEAHDRVAAEWRRSVREYHPECDDALTPEAYTLLKHLNGKISMIEHPIMKTKLYAELFKKLHIEYGNGYEMIYWSNTQEQQRLNEVAQVMVRVTMRGKELLRAMALKDQSAIN